MDLDSDDFFDPRMLNVVVLDDLMSTAAKDPRINDLFTEESHHRNLSVIALNHNRCLEEILLVRKRYFG
jgi:hypothetical protein